LIAALSSAEPSYLPIFTGLTSILPSQELKGPKFAVPLLATVKVAPPEKATRSAAGCS